MNDTLILAGADGAGSALHAEWGSALAVETAVAYVIDCATGWRMARDAKDRRAHLTRILASAFRAAHQALVDLAERKQVALRELATTLLVAVVSHGYTAAAQIGDGAIVYAREDSEGIAALTTPDRGEYINETAFLTQRDHVDQLQLRVVEGSARHLALFSDGFEPVAIEYVTGEPNRGLFTGLFEFMHNTPLPEVRMGAVIRLLKGKRICERSDDDITLLLASNGSRP